MITQTLGDRERELAAVDGAYTQFVEGMIYSPLAIGQADLAERRDRTPLVRPGERTGEGLIDHVGIDNVAAAGIATAHLVGGG